MYCFFQKNGVANICANNATHQDNKLVAAEKRLDAKVYLYEERLEEYTWKQVEKRGLSVGVYPEKNERHQLKTATGI